MVFPVDAVLGELKDALAAHQRCLLIATPGAGKTTRVPIALLDNLPVGKRWLLLEPRRVAARLAASYMATQLGEPVGKQVGYRVRGDNKVSQQTRLEVVTQGILTRMLQDDPLLEGIHGIIFDEFHERSLDADIGLALSLDVQQELREDLQILIMSATLDTTSLLAVLGPDTPVIESPGKIFPVETHYRASRTQERTVEHQQRVIQEALSSQEGDILVFLPGQREIHHLANAFSSPDSLTGHSDRVEVLTLHGRLPLKQQQAILSAGNSNKRRIILTTALAESSLTVPGVSIVVDGGWERRAEYHPRSGMTRLMTARVNQASADQRRGRAARTGPGVCYRLWPEESMLAAHRKPEIDCSDLESLQFELSRWGVEDSNTLPWVTPPPTAAMQAAREALIRLTLLSEKGILTPFGQRCAIWPTSPRLAIILQVALEAIQSDQPPPLQTLLAELACRLVTTLEGPEALNSDNLQAVMEINPESAARQPASRQWLQSYQQWQARFHRQAGIAPASAQHLSAAEQQAAIQDWLPRLLLQAWPERLATRRQDGLYQLVTGHQVKLDPGHVLSRHELLIVPSLDGNLQGARIYLACGMDKQTLCTIQPETAQWQLAAGWDQSLQRIVARERRVYRAGSSTLVLDSRPATTGLEAVSANDRQAAWLEAIRLNGLPWSDSDQQTIQRLRLAQQFLGEDWPQVSQKSLENDAAEWLLPHLAALTRFEQLQSLSLMTLYLQQLDWSLQQQLNDLLPLKLKVPSGSNIAINYHQDTPVLAVKLQEMFGMKKHPSLLNGRLPLSVHLLSPARRPVQVTQDLPGFWQSSYFAVRKEMRGRYPKHPWPEDPLTAPATAGTKRHQR
jgi:ATP-dependent helicase HrpB